MLLKLNLTLTVIWLIQLHSVICQNFTIDINKNKTISIFCNWTKHCEINHSNYTGPMNTKGAKKTIPTDGNKCFAKPKNNWRNEITQSARVTRLRNINKFHLVHLCMSRVCFCQVRYSCGIIRFTLICACHSNSSGTYTSNKSFRIINKYGVEKEASTSAVYVSNMCIMACVNHITNVTRVRGVWLIIETVLCTRNATLVDAVKKKKKGSCV